MIVDKACAERGCPCYDSRDGEEGVEMMRKEWVGLTDEERDEICLGDESKVRTVEALLKEKNT
jgi:hypothetical protein